MKSKKINVLVANNHLVNVGGSETFTYTLIEELNRRDNINVDYFTFDKGVVSDKIEEELKVNFFSKKKYDLIFASHNTCVEKLYKKGFIIQICHGIYPKLERPSHKANGIISISQEVQNHISSLGFSSKIVLNGINLKRFYPSKSISNKLKTVLSLCQSEEANRFIKQSCDMLNLDFIKANKSKERIWEIEDYINKSDVVVGLGRSVYDAMACGRPVIIYDHRHYLGHLGDGYISNTLGLSLLNNCSGRYFKYNFSNIDFVNELKKYNSLDGQYFRDFAERELDIKKNVNVYLEYWINLIKIQRKRKHQKIKKIFGERLFKILINIYSSFLLITRNK